jgi:hypothetical protein
LIEHAQVVATGPMLDDHPVGDRQMWMNVHVTGRPAGTTSASSGIVEAR